MYKMIVIDLDGTLLDDYKEISKENIDMINKAYQEKGVISVIATGKPIAQTEKIAHRVNKNFAKYIIASNGAIIKNTEKNAYLNKNILSKREVFQLLDICKREKLDYYINTTDKTLLENELISDYAEKDAEYNIQKDIKKYISENDIHMPLFLLAGTKENNPNIEEVLLKCRGEISKIKHLEMSLSSVYTFKNKEKQTTYVVHYIDIMKQGSTKKNAILILANHLGIKQEEIIVIGDGGNDVPMFEVAGLKVAMENAEDYLKQKADYVTGNNNDNGVAKAIHKFIFE